MSTPTKRARIRKAINMYIYSDKPIALPNIPQLQG